MKYMLFFAMLGIIYGIYIGTKQYVEKFGNVLINVTNLLFYTIPNIIKFMTIGMLYGAIVPIVGPISIFSYVFILYDRYIHGERYPNE